MTSEDIKKLAMAGKKGDAEGGWEWMDVADKLLWYECHEIYSKFRTGGISKEDGSKEITKAVMQWEKNKGTVERAFQINERLAKLYQDIEIKTSAFRLNPCIDTAKEMMEEIYGHTMKMKAES